MTRDPSLIAESASLRRALQAHDTLAALRASREWPDLEPRLGRLLGTVRRHHPPSPPPPAADPKRIHAVHWNIEHGNRFAEIEQGLRIHPRLAGADLMLLNEVDLGMARSGNRDVAGDLARALGLHGVWAPLFLETTPGRDEDTEIAAGGKNEEALFGLAVLSRWPIREVRVIELPSPEAYQFDREGMYGRHVGLVADIERPGAPLVAVSVHLEVHRTRRSRAAQMETLLRTLEGERRPVVLAGDFNSHTFDRGRWWDPWLGAIVLLLHPRRPLSERFLHPDRGGTREMLFDALHDAGFDWELFNDRHPTLQLRFDRLAEARGLVARAGSVARPLLGWAERRALLRLDWFAGRGWSGGTGTTPDGLDGPGRASDHAPIVAEFR